MARAMLLATIVVAALGTPAVAQGVTFDELKGRSVNMSRTELRRVRTATHGENDQDVQQSWTISISASGALSLSTTVYVDNKGGKKATRTWSASSTLGKPFSFRDGQSVIVFEAGTLNIMRTRQVGAAFNKVAFAKSGSGITCRLSGGIARENGTGGVKLGESGAVLEPTEVLSSKVTGTSCRVN